MVREIWLSKLWHKKNGDPNSVGFPFLLKLVFIHVSGRTQFMVSNSEMRIFM